MGCLMEGFWKGDGEARLFLMKKRGCIANVRRGMLVHIIKGYYPTKNIARIVYKLVRYVRY